MPPRFANIMPRAKQPSKKRAPARRQPKTREGAKRVACAGKPGFSNLDWRIALVTLVLDQATKYLVLYGLDLATRRAIYVAPFVDFVLAMNKGISYGLFPQDDEVGRWGLFAIKILASVSLPLLVTAHAFEGRSTRAWPFDRRCARECGRSGGTGRGGGLCVASCGQVPLVHL